MSNKTRTGKAGRDFNEEDAEGERKEKGGCRDEEKGREREREGDVTWKS